LRDPMDWWRSRTVRALILPSLCHPMILGLPFLSHNSLVIDYSSRSISPKNSSFDLLHPAPPFATPPPPPPITPSLRREQEQVQVEDILLWKKLLFTELKDFVRKYPDRFRSEPVAPFNVVAAVRARIEQLELIAARDKLSQELKDEFADVFGDIPHIDDLPTDITCKV
ncbi:hypothetical protein F5880DRAFT_1438807, partial [Lentinula raphanica]